MSISVVNKIMLVIFFFPIIIFSQAIIKTSYETVMEIGSDESLGADYIFQYPKFICVDEDNNIYIAEALELSIKVFNKNGKYIKSIGRRGRGPGEFLDITLMSIIDKKIIVFDNFAAKIVIFNTKGKLLREVKYTYDKILWPRSINKLGKNLLLGYKLPDAKGIFHEFDLEFNENKNIFPEQIFEIYDKELDHLFPEIFSNSVLVNNNKILTCKIIYDGNIYELEKSAGKWLVKKKYKGFVEHKYGFSRISNNESEENSKGEKKYELVIHSEGKKFIVKIFNKSLGLFKLKSGNIIHFTTVKISNQLKFGYELYNENMEFLNYFVLESQRFYFDKQVKFKIEILWKDDQDYFYLADYNGFPIIKKIKLNVKKL